MDVIQTLKDEEKKRKLEIKMELWVNGDCTNHKKREKKNHQKLLCGKRDFSLSHRTDIVSLNEISETSTRHVFHNHPHLSTLQICPFISNWKVTVSGPFVKSRRMIWKREKGRRMIPIFGCLLPLKIDISVARS
jgi:hypothetical protein